MCGNHRLDPGGQLLQGNSVVLGDLFKSLSFARPGEVSKRLQQVTARYIPRVGDIAWCHPALYLLIAVGWIGPIDREKYHSRAEEERRHDCRDQTAYKPGMVTPGVDEGPHWMGHSQRVSGFCMASPYALRMTASNAAFNLYGLACVGVMERSQCGANDGGAGRSLRTSLSRDSKAVPYAEQRSARPQDKFF